MPVVVPALHLLGLKCLHQLVADLTLQRKIFVLRILGGGLHRLKLLFEFFQREVVQVEIQHIGTQAIRIRQRGFLVQSSSSSFQISLFYRNLFRGLLKCIGLL